MPSAFELNASVNLDSASVNASAKQIQQALGRITGQASEFQKSLDASTARVFAFGATTAVLNGVTQSFKKLVATTIEVEKRLVEINSIFQATDATFNRFRNSIFKVAKETGQAFGTVADGAAELARQGLTAEETAKRLKAALVLTRISGLDAEKSVKALTAAINGFTSAGLTANSIVNKMVAVDIAFAVSAQDLAEAFSRAGSTAEDAGVSFNELLGLVTAVEQRTARGGAVIGNAFKSIFTRLARGSTIDKLKELGVEIDATQTGIQKLSALSAALERISDPTVSSQIKELAGGVFQINVVSAALKDLGSDTSIFASAAKTASNATNEAFEKNAALSKTLSAQINALVVGLTSVGEKIGKLTFGPLLENLVGIATKISDFFDKALDPEKGNVFIKGLFKTIGAFLGGPAIVIFTAAFVKIFGLVAKFAKDGLAAVFQIGSQTQKIQGIEGGIVSLLQRDSALRKVITSSTATQAQKEQAVIAAIQRENALLTQQAALMRTLATAAAARGVTGFGAGGFTGKRGKKFATGFQQEEAMATMLGAKNPKAHWSEGTINKKKFVMNNNELEVEGFGKNGDSAVIPMGYMGYAGGFVPNYASYNFGKFSLTGAKIPAAIKKGDITKEQAAAAGYKKGTTKPKPKKGPRKPDPVLIEGGEAAGAFMTPSGRGNIGKKSGSFTRGKDRVNWKVNPAFERFSPRLTTDAMDETSHPYDSQLEDRIMDGAIKAGAAYAKLLVLPKGKANKASPASIKSRLEKGGNKGGFGAVRGLAGATFEAAIFAAMDLAEYKGDRKKGDFDIPSFKGKAEKEVGQLFGIKGGFTRGDLKVGASEDTINSFAAKILKGSSKEKTYRDKWRKWNNANKKKGKAAGYIPNFARGGGVSASQIRIHRDADGRGEMITNTRDEPRGVQDAIKREKEGIGMYAGGFVPNYGGFNPTEMREATSKPRQKLDKETKKATGRMMGFTMALMGVQMGIQMLGERARGLNAEWQATHDQKKEEIANSDLFITEQLRLVESSRKQVEAAEESHKGFIAVADAANVAFTAMMSLGAVGTLVPQGAKDWAAGGIAAGAKGLNAKLLKAGPLLSTGAGKLIGAAGVLVAAGVAITNAVGEWKHANRAGISARQRGTEKGAAVGGAVGGMGGMAAGGAVGAAGAAAIGAAMGTTIAPVIGTVIGAGIGLLIGTFAGKGVGGAIGGAGKSDVAPRTPESAAAAEGIYAVTNVLADFFRDRGEIGKTKNERVGILTEKVLKALEDNAAASQGALDSYAEGMQGSAGTGAGGFPQHLINEAVKDKELLSKFKTGREKETGWFSDPKPKAPLKGRELAKARAKMYDTGEITAVTDAAVTDYAQTVEVASNELFDFVEKQKGGAAKVGQMNKALKDYNDTIVAITLKEKQASEDKDTERGDALLERLKTQRANADKNVTARLKGLAMITHETLDLTIAYNKEIAEATAKLHDPNLRESEAAQFSTATQESVLEETFDARQKGSHAAQQMAAQASLVVPAGPASGAISMLNTQAAGKANVQAELSAVTDIMANLKAAKGVDLATSDPEKAKALGEELATAEGKLADAISKLNLDLNNNITQLEGAIKAQKGLVERSGGEGIRVAMEAKKKAGGFVAEGLDLDALSASLNKIGDLSSKGRQGDAADELTRMQSIGKPFIEMFGQGKFDEFVGKKIAAAGGDTKAIIAEITSGLVTGGDAGDAEFFGKSVAETQLQAVKDNTIELASLTTALKETRKELGIDYKGEKVEGGPEKGSFAAMLGDVPTKVMDMTTDVTKMRESTKKIITGLEDGELQMEALVKANNEVTTAATKAFEKATTTIAAYDVILEEVKKEVEDVKKLYKGKVDDLKE